MRRLYSGMSREDFDSHLRDGEIDLASISEGPALIQIPGDNDPSMYWLPIDEKKSGGMNDFQPCIALRKNSESGLFEVVERAGAPWVQGLIIQHQVSGHDDVKFYSSRACRQVHILEKLKRTTQTHVKANSNGLFCVRTDIHKGVSLSRYLNSRKDFQLNFFGATNVAIIQQRVFTFFRTALEEMDQLHRLGYAHCDATASNFIFDEETGACRLIDFDTCEILGEVREFSVEKTDQSPPEHAAGHALIMRSSYDYHMLALTLGRVLINEFNEQQLDAVESDDHRAMLSALVVTLIDKVIEPMSVHSPKERQSVKDSLKILAKLQDEFAAWQSAARSKRDGYSAEVVVRQQKQEVRQREANEQQMPLVKQISALKNAAISKLRRYYRVGLAIRILTLGFGAKRRFMSDADKLASDCAKNTDANSSVAVEELLIQWRVLLCMGNVYREKSAFRDAFEELLADSNINYGNQFTVENLDAKINEKRLLASKVNACADRLFKDGRFSDNLDPRKAGQNEAASVLVV